MGNFSTRLFVLILLLAFNSTAFADSRESIKTVIAKYFEGYQKADSKLIQEVFHPSVRLLGVDQGKLDETTMETWIKGLNAREAQGDIRQGDLQIQSINVKDYAASVKLKMRFEKFEFTDYLSLLKIEGQWIIVGKIYHFQLR